jgi:hypothetical protein
MRLACRSNQSWLALSLLAALSCDRSKPEPEPEPALLQVPAEPSVRERETPTLTITARSDETSTPQTRFSIAATRDLHICSTWSALEGEHFETRHFYAPPGELYYQKLIPFSTDIEAPYPFTHPVSIPHATAIRPVLPNERGELVVCDQLAVAGAWIGDHQLTGAWRLDISLDDSKTAANSFSFEIAP